MFRFPNLVIFPMKKVAMNELPTLELSFNTSNMCWNRIKSKPPKSLARIDRFGYKSLLSERLSVARTLIRKGLSVYYKGRLCWPPVRYPISCYLFFFLWEIYLH